MRFIYWITRKVFFLFLFVVVWNVVTYGFRYFGHELTFLKDGSVIISLTNFGAIITMLFLTSFFGNPIWSVINKLFVRHYIKASSSNKLKV